MYNHNKLSFTVPKCTADSLNTFELLKNITLERQQGFFRVSQDQGFLIHARQGWFTEESVVLETTGGSQQQKSTGHVSDVSFQFPGC